MAPGIVFLLMTALGWGIFRLMKVTRESWDPWLERVAAVAFLSAGVVLPEMVGWVGQLLRGIVDAINTVGGALGQAALGAGIMWIVALALGLVWFLGLLPDRWFDFKIPDWLSVAGILLPSLWSSIPGPMGQVIAEASSALAGLLITAATGLVT